MSGVSVRTIRYYDRQGLLKPSAYSKAGHRLYTDEDFAKLKRILALKYLGFSLEEVMNIENSPFKKTDMLKSFQIQKQILKNKMHHMELILATIEETESSMTGDKGLDWREMIDIIKVIEDEKVVRQKFIDASNLSAEIQLIDQLSSDKNWYEWVFERIVLETGDQVLELGCGEGALWYKNELHVPPSLNVMLTEVTAHLLSCAKENLSSKFPHFQFKVTDLEKLPFADETFDVIIANHVLFFSKQVEVVLAEVSRVLKKGGRFYCSTIDAAHMQELEVLIKNYNKDLKIGKSEQLQNFGYDKAKSLLAQQFAEITIGHYHDELVVPHPDGLLSYIYSIPTIDSHKKADFESYLYKQMVVEQADFKISNCHILFSSRKKVVDEEEHVNEYSS